MREAIRVHDFLDHKTLITGEVNSGKTRFCLNILNAFLQAGMSDIAVLDFAPASIHGIGGKLIPPRDAGVLYLSAGISAPRLMGRNEDEILELARCNARMIELLIDFYLEDPRDIVFINDMSLYLHAGRITRILPVFDLSSTAVVNAYYGSSFPDTDLTKREKAAVEQLMNLADRVIVMAGPATG